MVKSLCPTCYTEIPATVYPDGRWVVMRKDCPDHGRFHSIVESDAGFYDFCQKHDSGTIYDGHLVDVTTRCNLRCRYCYYRKDVDNRPIDDILADCQRAPGPYILTGGEPTIHPQIHEIIEWVKTVGRTTMLTNGYGLSDLNRAVVFADQLTDADGLTQIGLSFHSEALWFGRALTNIKKLGLKLTTLFFVVDSLEQLPAIVRFAEAHSDYFHCYRIKIASSIWAEQKSARLFTSDIVRWFSEQPGQTELPAAGKITYFPLKHNNILYAVVNWYNVTNIILDDIDTPPTYTTKDGQVMDFVKAMIYNEGLGQ